jgi:gas vesicle protein
MQMKGNFHALVWISILLVSTACNASQASGTYVAHASTFAEMLQLTQTSDGQISGVLSHVELKSDGSVSSELSPVNGTADADQLTLKFPSVLSFISGESLAGTISGNAIHLQIVDSSGNVSSETFERSSVSQFKAYADEMKSRGQGIAYNAKLLNLAREYRETVANAENWIANAQAHAQRIPNAKADYDRIESQMHSLVERERQTLDSVSRSQISVAVTQADIAGEQVDIQVQQVWDLGIGDSGAKLEKEFTGWDGNCGTDQQLRKQGATDQAISAWDQACKQAMSERAKFEPIYKQMSEQRAELRSFQATAQAHRKNLVGEANRIQ